MTEPFRDPTDPADAMADAILRMEESRAEADPRWMMTMVTLSGDQWERLVGLAELHKRQRDAWAGK